MKGWYVLATLILACLAVGCTRQPDANYVPSQQVQKLKPELRESVQTFLKRYCGTLQAPKLLGSEGVSRRTCLAARRFIPVIVCNATESQATAMGWRPRI